MAKFDCNERVIFTVDGVKHRGRVTSVAPCVRRVVTDTGKRLEVSVRSLRASPDRVLILETRLDRSLRSIRSYGPMMQQWLTAYDVVTLYERVHTIEDMRRFLARDGRNIATRYIHVMSHGTFEHGVGPLLHLTFERMPLKDHLDVFKGLDGKVLIFSSCQIGARPHLLEEIKEVSGAAAVISYRLDVEDFYTNLAETLLYDRLIRSSEPPSVIVSRICDLFRQLGVKTGGKLPSKPVIVCV
ncbi:hypothetical protein JXA32_01460 [Candidatus Sumerlaeota bacterium]|nr:hypothetical protein [Candidatus Sumerlaeota bacterium]